MKKHLPIIFISFFLVILVSLFLWKEKLSTSFPINSNKIGDFATTIGSLLTALTVFLLYRQIQEMIADRKASNQPDIFPTETQFETEDTKFEKFLQPRSDLPVPLFHRINGETRDATNSLAIKLYNIGLGAAKEIKINWVFSKEEVREFLHNVYDGEDYGEREKNIDFIPAGTNVEISLPYTYMKTCGTQLNMDILGYKEENKREKPELTLSIKFKDIYSNVHMREFDVKANCFLNSLTVKFHQKK